jgi:cytochrome d ubiquinol oxidase subunit II
VLGLGALVLVTRQAHRGARPAAVGAVVGVIGAWGVAQWDYLLPTSLTVTAAAAPTGTMAAVFVAVGIAAVVVVPAFVLLYALDQKTLLPDEGVTEPTTPRSRP